MLAIKSEDQFGDLTTLLAFLASSLSAISAFQERAVDCLTASRIRIVSINKFESEPMSPASAPRKAV